MKWFGNSWEGKEVVFPARDDQPATTWKLGTKLASERFSLMLPSDNYPSAAWVPFECKQVGASGPEHVMKIYMQYVYYLFSSVYFFYQ